MEIQEKFRQNLSKYLTEISVSIPNISTPEITRKNLKTEYNDSIRYIIKKILHKSIRNRKSKFEKK